MITIVRTVCLLAGGPTRLAAQLGISRQNFYQWKEIPAERVLDIEVATNGRMTRSQMRPDIYPPVSDNDNTPPSHTVNNEKDVAAFPPAPGVQA